MRIATLLLIIWLVIGAIAAGQRGYYGSENADCSSIGTIAVTIIAGPLNYLGVNPRVENCDLPEPSQ